MGISSMATLGYGVIIQDDGNGPWLNNPKIKVDEWGDWFEPLFDWIELQGLSAGDFEIYGAGNEYAEPHCSHLVYRPASLFGFNYWTEVEMQDLASKEEEAKQAFAKLFTGQEDYIEQGPNWILSHTIS